MIRASILVLAAASLALAGAASAQTPGAPPPPTAAPASAPAATPPPAAAPATPIYSDQQMRAFAKATIDLQAMSSQDVEGMSRAIEATGISVEQYNAMGDAMRANPSLAARLDPYLQAARAERAYSQPSYRARRPAMAAPARRHAAAASRHHRTHARASSRHRAHATRSRRHRHTAAKRSGRHHATAHRTTHRTHRHH